MSKNAGPGDNWFSLKSLKITRTVINYPDINYAYPTVLKNFIGLFEHALLNGLIKQNEETDNFLTNISGNKWNVSKQRKDILDIIADVVKKSQMELILADKKLEQTMIALIILYAFAMSDEKQWKPAVTKGTVVLNFIKF